MRAVELVRGTEENIGFHRFDVRPFVGRRVDGVHPGEGARLVGELADAMGVDGRAERIRSEREGDDSGSVREQRLEVGEVVVGETHDDPDVVLKLQPGRDVGVVVEPRADDLVALAQLPAERAGQHEVEVGHARPEDRLFRGASEEARGRCARLFDERPASPARFELAADVRVRLAEVVRDRVDHRVGNLRPGRPVEERVRPLERGEPRADRLDVVG